MFLINVVHGETVTLIVIEFVFSTEFHLTLKKPRLERAWVPYAANTSLISFGSYFVSSVLWSEKIASYILKLWINFTLLEKEISKMLSFLFGER